MEQERGWSELDIDKLIRNWITMNLQIRSDGNNISIGYMREGLFGSERVFHEVDSCKIPAPIHIDNMRFG